MSITSTRSTVDIAWSAFLCPRCGHVQKPAFQNASDYYDKEYRISLESEDFDQVYDVVDGRCIFRTDYQAEQVLKSVHIPAAGKVLDYGAGKASTLRRILEDRPDIVPFVFDISGDYKNHWSAFLPRERQAHYQVPESWGGTFSLVTAHFVLEHAANPDEVLSDIARLLLPDGALFLSVPNLLGNPGDLLAADHINHFSPTSLQTALTKARLVPVTIDAAAFRGAFLCVARRGIPSPSAARAEGPDWCREVQRIAEFWLKCDDRLDAAAKTLSHLPSAVYGAGVYGSHVVSRIGQRVPLRCFLDQSPHLTGGTHMGLPIRSPSDMPPDIRMIYAGLNPAIARGVLEPFRNRGIQHIVYLDESEV